MTSRGKGKGGGNRGTRSSPSPGAVLARPEELHRKAEQTLASAQAEAEAVVAEAREEVAALRSLGRQSAEIELAEMARRIELRQRALEAAADQWADAIVAAATAAADQVRRLARAGPDDATIDVAGNAVFRAEPHLRFRARQAELDRLSGQVTDSTNGSATRTSNGNGTP